MPTWVQNLFEGWPMIRANLPLFVIITALIIGIVWAIFGFSYGTLIASKDGQIQLQDRQLADYKDKLQGATPDQAKARIDALEARLTAIEPRRLSDSQRTTLIQNLKLPAGIIYQITIASEGTGDSAQYAADFSAAFRAAGTWNISEAMVMGIGNRPPHGIGILFPDLNNRPPEAEIIMKALRLAAIPFEIQQGGNMPTSKVQLLICTKIVR